MKHLLTILVVIAIVIFIYMSVEYHNAARACKAIVPVHHDWAQILDAIEKK